MSSFQPEKHPQGEQRKSYRCEVSGPRRDSRLKIGDQELASEILDESAGGYSVVLSEAPVCVAGAVGLLKSASGWAEVQIMSRQPLGPTASEETADALPKLQTRLGLMRLRTVEEVDDATDLSAELPWLSLKALSGFFGAVARSLTTTAGVTIGALVLGTLLVYWIERTISLMPELDADLKQTTAQQKDNPPPPERAAAKKWHIKLGPAPTVPQTVPQVTTAAKEPSAVSGNAHRTSQFDELRAALENPEIRELPGLSREHIRQLRDWADEYRTAARNAAAVTQKAAASAATAATPSERRLEFLTEEQQRDLMRLLSTPDSSEEPASPVTQPIEATAK